MEPITNKEVLEKIEELVDDVKQLDRYRRFQKVKDKMQQNQELMTLISSYKKCQQQLVKASYRKQRDEVEKQEEQLRLLEEKMYEIPLYVEYISLQEELDLLFQQIKNYFDDYFMKKLNEI